MIQTPPHGLDEIIATYGSLDDKSFEIKNIVSFDLPYPLYYDGNPVHRTRCHRAAVENFIFAFEQIRAKSLIDACKNYGGIYNRRSIRGHASHPSCHSWGIAIDLEPNRYILGSLDRFPEAVVDIFADAGFFYGGDFKSRKDPMHFQLCTGY